MARILIHVSVYLRGDSIGQDAIATLMSQAHGSMIRPQLAWTRGFDQPGGRVEETFVGMTRQPHTDDLFAWDRNEEPLDPYEVLADGLPLTRITLPDRSHEILHSLRATALPNWHLEVRGEVPLYLLRDGSLHRDWYFRKLWLDPYSGPCPLLELGVSKYYEDEASYTVSMISFAPVWFRPFAGSQSADFLPSPCADLNLRAWCDWVLNFSRTYSEHIDEVEVRVGAPSVVSDQLEMVHQMFAAIPKMRFTLAE